MGLHIRRWAHPFPSRKNISNHKSQMLAVLLNSPFPKQFPFPFPPLLPSHHALSRRRLLPHRLLPLLMADPSRSSPTAAGDTLLAAAAADVPDAALPAAPDPDVEFGFQRPELGKEKLVGTVQFHERHVFLCYKGPEVWPSHVEAAESDRLPRLLAAAIKARKPNLKKSVSIHLFPRLLLFGSEIS